MCKFEDHAGDGFHGRKSFIPETIYMHEFSQISQEWICSNDFVMHLHGNWSEITNVTYGRMDENDGGIKRRHSAFRRAGVSVYRSLHWIKSQNANEANRRPTQGKEAEP